MVLNKLNCQLLKIIMDFSQAEIVFPDIEAKYAKQAKTMCDFVSPLVRASFELHIYVW